MKILMITSYLPYPLFGGGEVRTYNLLKRLGEKHEITLISYTRPANTTKDLEEVKKFCKAVFTLPKSKTWTLKNILRTGFSTMPLLLTVYHSQKDAGMIGNIIHQNSFDLIHAEPFYVMHNIPVTKLPILLVEHNIEYQVYSRYVDYFPFPPLRPILHVDVLKMKKWEETMWRKADYVACVSENDKKVIETERTNTVEVIPNGVDLNDFQFCQRAKDNTKPTILYVGDMRWFENVDATDYLIKEILPRIKKQIPNIHLSIVGREADKHFSKKSSDYIEVNANVSNIRQFYYQADCLLAPIRKGGGTKYKIIEAMASGLPVVTTNIGMEGLGIEDNKHVKVGSTASELAQQAEAIINDRKMALTLARNARILVEQKYSWDIIAEKLDYLYDKIAHEKH